MITSDAYISPCRQFRYDLTRVWGPYGRLLHVVMLNPSTADATANDPTIKRLIHRGKEEEYDGIVVNNLYAFRATYPSVLLNRYTKSYEIIGAENNARIAAAAANAEATCVAWGSHVLVSKRERKVLEILYGVGKPVHCVGLTTDGYPKHPLHVAYAARLTPYRGRFSTLVSREY